MLKMGSKVSSVCRLLNIIVYGTLRWPTTFLPLSQKARSTSKQAVQVTQHHKASLCKSLYTWKQAGLQ